jgi:hypothetical protein
MGKIIQIVTGSIPDTEGAADHILYALDDAGDVYRWENFEWIEISEPETAEEETE